MTIIGSKKLIIDVTNLSFFICLDIKKPASY